MSEFPLLFCLLCQSRCCCSTGLCISDMFLQHDANLTNPRPKNKTETCLLETLHCCRMMGVHLLGNLGRFKQGLISTVDEGDLPPPHSFILFFFNLIVALILLQVYYFFTLGYYCALQAIRRTSSNGLPHCRSSLAPGFASQVS